MDWRQLPKERAKQSPWDRRDTIAVNPLRLPNFNPPAGKNKADMAMEQSVTGKSPLKNG
jgi:hypothetical protein